MSDEKNISATVTRLKIITLALVSGPTLFLGVVGIIAFNSGGDATPVEAAMNSGAGTAVAESSAEPDNTLILLLTLIALAMSVTCTFAGTILQKLTVSRGVSGDAPLEKKLMVIQSGQMMRMALTEGPALFGVVTILIAVLHPGFPVIAYVNLIPLTLLYVVAAISFPTRERVDAQLNPAADGQAGRYRK